MTQKFTIAGTVAISITAIMGSITSADDTHEVTIRPATLEDLVGTWRMVEIKLNRQFNHLDPFVLAHQRYHFASNGRMKTITSTPPFKPMLLDIFDRRDPATTFNIRDDGAVTITSLAWRKMNRFTARLVTSGNPKEDKHPHAGDLILTWPGSQSKPAAVKLMRKVTGKRRGRTLEISR